MHHPGYPDLGPLYNEKYMQIHLTSLITSQANITESRVGEHILLKLREISVQSGLQVRQNGLGSLLWGFVKGMMSWRFGH